MIMTFLSHHLFLLKILCLLCSIEGINLYEAFVHPFLQHQHTKSNELTVSDLPARDSQCQRNKVDTRDQKKDLMLPKAVKRRNVLSTSATILAWALPGLVGIKNKPALALSPEQASDAYDSYATTYNELDGGGAASVLGINEGRSRMLRQAKGRVLEIGVGTGLNLDYYLNIESLSLVDISEGMLQQAKERVKTLGNLKGVEVRFYKADATRDLVDLFGPNSFDSVVDTFSLCVMGNDGAKAALQQMSQVVKTDAGRVFLLENSKSSNKLLGWYQDVTAETAATAGGKGCVYNQDVAAMIDQTQGLKAVHEEEYAAGLFRSFECISNKE